MSNTEDCNDDPDNNGEEQYPGRPEVCDGLDNNCNSQTDENVGVKFITPTPMEMALAIPICLSWAVKVSKVMVSNGDDCDDALPEFNPNTPEICDDIDNDCDGGIDEGVKNTYYIDADGDGFGVDDVTVLSCTQPDGFSDNRFDCDDVLVEFNPDAEEICDDLDNDCDGAIDEGLSQIYYVDGDGDGFGDPTTATETCLLTGNLVDNNDDCDDLDGEVYPFRDEICDDIDNDCNGRIDEGVLNTYYIDSDGDGFGSSNTVLSCEIPVSSVENDDDCDDTTALRYPGLQEICDGIDNNCDFDSLIDEGVTTSFYIDSDGDGYGDQNATAQNACVTPEGFVDNSDDCDDAMANKAPNLQETCDGIDNNCQNGVDEDAIDAATFYLDDDSDGFGDPTQTILGCDGGGNYVSNDNDCNDDPANNGFLSNPDALEQCDNLDNDCDGDIDENFKSNDLYASMDIRKLSYIMSNRNRQCSTFL